MSRHGAIVLAAGQSRRLGQPKQALLLEGRSLEQRACELAAATDPLELLLVRAADDDRPLPALALCRIDTAPGGMGLSLATAIAASTAHVDGWLVLLVDQPALDLAHLRALLDRWRQQPGQPVASAYADTVGVPAVLPLGWRDRLLQLQADSGARAWLRSAPNLALVRNEALAADVDLPQDLR